MQKFTLRYISCLLLCIGLISTAPSIALACEGAAEEKTLELSEGKLPFEQSFKFPAGAPPKPPLDWKIENVGPTNEVTLGVLALGGANAADYAENGGCDNAKLKPLAINSCTDVIKLEKETGKAAEITGEGTYANSGFKAKFKLNLSH
jgi:hypothetical protein